MLKQVQDILKWAKLVRETMENDEMKELIKQLKELWKEIQDVIAAFKNLKDSDGTVR